MSQPTADAEGRALSRSPVFRALLEEGRADKEQGGLTPEDLDRLHPLSDLDREYAKAFGAALDRLEEAQGAEVTDEQARLLKLILTAADYARGRAPLDRLAEDSGIDEPTLHAAAAALVELGLTPSRPAARAG
jgi:hypothetical protein